MRDSGTSIRFAGAFGFALSTGSTSKSYRVIDKTQKKESTNLENWKSIYSTWAIVLDFD